MLQFGDGAGRVAGPHCGRDAMLAGAGVFKDRDLTAELGCSVDRRNY